MSTLITGLSRDFALMRVVRAASFRLSICIFGLFRATRLDASTERPFAQTIGGLTAAGVSNYLSGKYRLQALGDAFADFGKLQNLLQHADASKPNSFRACSEHSATSTTGDFVIIPNNKPRGQTQRTAKDTGHQQFHDLTFNTPNFQTLHQQLPLTP